MRIIFYWFITRLGGQKIPVEKDDNFTVIIYFYHIQQYDLWLFRGAIIV